MHIAFPEAVASSGYGTAPGDWFLFMSCRNVLYLLTLPWSNIVKSQKHKLLIHGTLESALNVILRSMFYLCLCMLFHDCYVM